VWHYRQIAHSYHPILSPHAPRDEYPAALPLLRIHAGDDETVNAWPLLLLLLQCDAMI
jgi:hypothetical protein